VKMAKAGERPED